MSIREIARMTGLSITTVSHAINGTRPVSEKSRRLGRGGHPPDRLQAQPRRPGAQDPEIQHHRADHPLHRAGQLDQLLLFRRARRRQGHPPAARLRPDRLHLFRAQVGYPAGQRLGAQKELDRRAPARPQQPPQPLRRAARGRRPAHRPARPPARRLRPAARLLATTNPPPSRPSACWPIRAARASATSAARSTSRPPTTAMPVTGGRLKSAGSPSTPGLSAWGSTIRSRRGGKRPASSSDRGRTPSLPPTAC